MGHSHKQTAAARLTVGELVLRSAEYLKNKGADSPRLDAEILLAALLKTDRLHLYLDWDKPLTDIEVAAYREMIRRRGANREPVARILGRREFYGREFVVTPAVFSPRPETEGLVERALEFLRLSPQAESARPTVFEVGTGSGAIVVSLAVEFPGPQYVASDVSADALAVAKRNAEAHGVAQRIAFRHGALFAGFEGPLWCLVSNPPYIRRDEIPTLPPEVRTHDPMAALDGGADGLDVVRDLAEYGARLLRPGGALFLEIGQDQGPDALAIFKARDTFGDVRIEEDFNGHDRFLCARRAVTPVR